MSETIWQVYYKANDIEHVKFTGPYAQASMYKDMLNDEQTDNNLPRIFELKRVT